GPGHGDGGAASRCDLRPRRVRPVPPLSGRPRNQVAAALRPGVTGAPPHRHGQDHQGVAAGRGLALPRPRLLEPRARRAPLPPPHRRGPTRPARRIRGPRSLAPPRRRCCAPLSTGGSRRALIESVHQEKGHTSMSVMKRLSGIVQAKANKALDKAENPADMLDLSYEKQAENLTKVRRALADVATAKKRLELQAAELQGQAGKLQEQAKQALGQGQEDLARQALSRRAGLADQLTELGTQHSQVEAQQQQLENTATRLSAQIEAFRTKKETLKASYTASQAQASIGEAVSGISE